MKRQKAISILQKQIDKLEDKKNLNHNWTIETRSYLINFFGQDSEQHKYLNDFNWKPGIASNPENFKPKISTFLNDCINTINNIGLKKEPVENWFSKLPSWIISSGLSALCFISFSLGILLTKNNNSELKKENTLLKEKLLQISSDTIAKQQKKLKKIPSN